MIIAFEHPNRTRRVQLKHDRYYPQYKNFLGLWCHYYTVTVMYLFSYEKVSMPTLEGAVSFLNRVTK